MISKPSISSAKLSSLAFLLVLFLARDATASFHLMQIRQVMAGAGGDSRIQFIRGVSIHCDEACDVNEDGERNITDAIFTLNFLYLGTAQIGAPYPACDVGPIAGCLEEACASTG